jgi:hypothetical protein
MTVHLAAEQLQQLVSEVENRLESEECDHTLRHTPRWARAQHVNPDDVIDIVESHGGFCDCEVVHNVPVERAIVLEESELVNDPENPWRVPLAYSPPDEATTYSKFLISRQNLKNKCYATNGEWLVPAPQGAKARKRTRRSVHFFVGLRSGLPNEIAFVGDGQPVTAAGFAKAVRDSGFSELRGFTARDAH